VLARTHVCFGRPSVGRRTGFNIALRGTTEFGRRLFSLSGARSTFAAES